MIDHLNRQAWYRPWGRRGRVSLFCVRHLRSGGQDLSGREWETTN
jgi:hypothetical protein